MPIENDKSETVYLDDEHLPLPCGASNKIENVACFTISEGRPTAAPQVRYKVDFGKASLTESQVVFYKQLDEGGYEVSFSLQSREGNQAGAWNTADFDGTRFAAICWYKTDEWHIFEPEDFNQDHPAGGFTLVCNDLVGGQVTVTVTGK